MPTLAIDFDRTVYSYPGGYGDGTIDGPPVPGARDALRALHAEGHRLILHTTRARDEQQVDQIIAWLEQHDMRELFAEITHEKPLAVLFVDDRAVPHRGDWTRTLADVRAFLLDGHHIPDSQPPIVGEIVHYRSKVSGATLAAIITGTIDTLTPEGLASGGVDPLDSPTHVHLHVLSPGRYGHGRERAAAVGIDFRRNHPGYYQEFNVANGNGVGQWS